VLVGFGVVAESVVAEHQIVVRLQVFGIDGESLFEFLDRVGVAFLKKEDTAKLVAHDAVAWELRKHDSQVSDRAVVIAVFLEGAGVEVVGAS